MTQHSELPVVIERFLDEPVAAPSLHEVRAAGATAVRRRRRRGLVGGSVAVVLLIGGVALGQTALRGDGDRADDLAVPPVDALVEPPPGMRWVGIGRVAVAAPAAWSDGAIRCGQPTEDTVYFPSDGDIERCGVLGRHSSLEISDEPLLPPNDPNVATEGLVDGHEVQTARGCLHAIDGPCFAYIGVPDLDAYFRVNVYALNAEARVQAIVDSLIVLPEEQPVIPVKEGRDPYPLDALTCDGNKRSGGTIDVMPPRSAEGARDQGWPTDPLAAVEGVPDAPAWRRLGIVDLTLLHRDGNGVTRVSAQDAEGRTVLIMRVEELVRDAWAMTGFDACS